MQNLLECETHRKERPNNAIIRANQGGGGKLPFLAASLATLALFAVVTMSATLLGDTPLASAQPSQKVVQISAGGDHTCALLESGGLLCWGLNDVDQAFPPEGEYIAVDAGWRHTCASTKQNEVVCWGRNLEGQSASPTPGWSRRTNDRDYTVVFASGVTATCASHELKGDDFHCWGSITDVFQNKFSQVAVGRAHFCAVSSRLTPAVSCSGDDSYGQTSSTPDGSFSAMDAGDDYTCAITSAGAISCWGRSIHGQADAPQGRYVDIATGAEHACGIAAAGSIRCWGRNNHGQTDVPGGTNWKLAAAGGSHSCAVNEDGKVTCWGRNNHEQLDVPAAIAATPTFTVDVSAAPEDGGSVAGAGSYRSGRTARLTATPAEGYRFVRWIGDASGTASSVRLTVNDDKTATAVFDLIGDRDETPMISDGAMTAEFPAGRIVARRLDDGRTEFGYQPQGGERVLPAQRYFPANATVDRWLSSSAVIVDGEEVGQINARLLDDGRIEFAFTPTNGERILPSSRFFPISSGGNWLRSSLLE